MAAPKRDNNLAAKALIEAQFLGDAKACQNFGITRQTLRNYRAALSEDLELLRCFTELLQNTENQHWLKQLDASMLKLLNKILNALEGVEVEGLETIERLVVILDSLAEIRLNRDMYGVDKSQGEGEETQGKGTASQARGASAGATSSSIN